MCTATWYRNSTEAKPNPVTQSRTTENKKSRAEHALCCTSQLDHPCCYPSWAGVSLELRSGLLDWVPGTILSWNGSLICIILISWNGSWAQSTKLTERTLRSSTSGTTTASRRRTSPPGRAALTACRCWWRMVASCPLLPAHTCNLVCSSSQVESSTIFPICTWKFNVPVVDRVVLELSFCWMNCSYSSGRSYNK
jgi:hypothetical protein